MCSCIISLDKKGYKWFLSNCNDIHTEGGEGAGGGHGGGRGRVERGELIEGGKEGRKVQYVGEKNEGNKEDNEKGKKIM